MLQLAAAEGKDRRAQQADASAAASRLAKAEAQLRALRTGDLPKVPALFFLRGLSYLACLACLAWCSWLP